MKNLAPLKWATMFSALLAGCSVGPNYHRPAVQTPTAFREPAENRRSRRKRFPMRIFRGGKFFRIRNYKNSSAPP